jgi:hypothetical protein
MPKPPRKPTISGQNLYAKTPDCPNCGSASQWEILEHTQRFKIFSGTMVVDIKCVGCNMKRSMTYKARPGQRKKRMR